jgi:Bacterial alpha-L-rhamnosidase 6 hairpin glycosidase domain
MIQQLKERKAKMEKHKWCRLRNWAMAAIILPLYISPVAAHAQAPNAISSPEFIKSGADHSARLTTQYIDAKISLDYPGFVGLSVDSLAKEHFPLVVIDPLPQPWRHTQAIRRGSRVEYRGDGITNSKTARWTIEVKKKAILLVSHWTPADLPEPLTMHVETGVSHVTLLGLMQSGGPVQLPALMHFPDQGTFRISAEPRSVQSLGYAAKYAGKVVQITFPAATEENPTVKYRWEVVSIHPRIAGADSDARFDGFRRDWLNIFQLSPRWHTLSNNVTGETCAFVYYEYADIAKWTPQLAERLRALDMIRQTLDGIIGGTKAYGMPGNGAFGEFAEDTAPSLLIAADDYVEGTKDNQWLASNYGQLKSWTDKMLATDHEGNGLIAYGLSGNSYSWLHPKYRPSNWWDDIGFGYEDAYSNALAYRALGGMVNLAAQTGHIDDETRYHAAAEKLKSSYFKTFYDPATGVIAGWRSADGQLHDYYFLWVNGIAIHYGLVPQDRANEIMDRLLAKMKEVGYTNFALGLPGNLIPVARKDYFALELRWGGGNRADNSDGFQIYENGGATACFAYFTVAALYDLGRIEDADRILFPMLESFAKGDFQGFDANKKSKDWKMWNGTGSGYEGLLVDNYYALLAVLDREVALKRKM